MCISSVVAFVLSWFVDFSIAIILIWCFFSYIKLKNPFGKLIILKWDVLFCPFMYVAHEMSKFYVLDSVCSCALKIFFLALSSACAQHSKGFRFFCIDSSQLKES